MKEVFIIIILIGTSLELELHLQKIDLITERLQELAHIEIHGEQIFINKLIGGGLLVLLTKQIQ